MAVLSRDVARDSPSLQAVAQSLHDESVTSDAKRARLAAAGAPLPLQLRFALGCALVAVASRDVGRGDRDRHRPMSAPPTPGAGAGSGAGAGAGAGATAASVATRAGGAVDDPVLTIARALALLLPFSGTGAMTPSDGANERSVHLADCLMRATREERRASTATLAPGAAQPASNKFAPIFSCATEIALVGAAALTAPVQRALSRANADAFVAPSTALLLRAAHAAALGALAAASVALVAARKLTEGGVRGMGESAQAVIDAIKHALASAHRQVLPAAALDDQTPPPQPIYSPPPLVDRFPNVRIETVEALAQLSSSPSKELMLKHSIPQWKSLLCSLALRQADRDLAGGGSSAGRDDVDIVTLSAAANEGFGSLASSTPRALLTRDQDTHVLSLLADTVLASVSSSAGGLCAAYHERVASQTGSQPDEESHIGRAVLAGASGPRVRAEEAAVAAVLKSQPNTALRAAAAAALQADALVTMNDAALLISLWARLYIARFDAISQQAPLQPQQE